MTTDKPGKRKGPPAVPGKASPASAPKPDEPKPDEAPSAKSLELPRGAMLVMRVSGGVHFTTQEMAVYPDGRVTHGTGDTSRKTYERAARTLNDAQVMRLRRLLEQSGFFRVTRAGDKQSPDTYAYEILARLGSKNNRIEVFTGTMPDGIQELVDYLMRWMPEEHTDPDKSA